MLNRRAEARPAEPDRGSTHDIKSNVGSQDKTNICVFSRSRVSSSRPGMSRLYTRNQDTARNPRDKNEPRLPRLRYAVDHARGTDNVPSMLPVSANMRRRDGIDGSISRSISLPTSAGSTLFLEQNFLRYNTWCSFFFNEVQRLIDEWVDQQKRLLSLLMHFANAAGVVGWKLRGSRQFGCHKRGELDLT